LAEENLKPQKLKRHLETVHAECAGYKTLEFFHINLNEFNRLKQLF
jgi:hypothetical protein